MIVAKELRIGNKIFNGTVVATGPDYFIFDDGFTKWDSRKLTDGSIEPIELTPELLRNCPQAYGKNFFELTSLGEGIYLCVEEEGIYFQSEPADSVETHRTKIDIKYLHQFQNLYFALTGTELEVVFNKTP